MKFATCKFQALYLGFPHNTNKQKDIKINSFFNKNSKIRRKCHSTKLLWNKSASSDVHFIIKYLAYVFLDRHSDSKLLRKKCSNISDIVIMLRVFNILSLLKMYVSLKEFVGLTGCQAILFHPLDFNR